MRFCVLFWPIALFAVLVLSVWCVLSCVLGVPCFRVVVLFVCLFRSVLCRTIGAGDVVFVVYVFLSCVLFCDLVVSFFFCAVKSCW